MNNQKFKKGSYNFKDEGVSSKLYKRFFTNLAFEPELKQFVLEGWNGEKKRSTNYRAGWNIDEHRVSLSELLARYGTDLNNGLQETNVERNREAFGANVLQPPKKTSEFVKLASNVLLGLNLLLWICGVLTLTVGLAQYFTGDSLDDAYGSLYSGMSLIVVVIIAGCFAYYQEFQSNRIMESFKKMVPQFVTVIRSGQRFEINSTELVVGDCIELNYGDKLPADVRLIECQSFKVDNSAITGESDPQTRVSVCTDKDPMESKNLAFFATNVVQGNAKGIVIMVGNKTMMGKIAKLAASVPREKTPINKEMTIIIRLMTTISLFFGVIFYGIGISMNYTWFSALFFVIGIVVANVPENLNVTLTIILALAAKKMAKKNCLVKQLHAVETLGSASVICSDKTGTLTQNRMNVAHLWFNGNIAEADTSEFEKKDIGKYDNNDPGFLQLANIAILCSRASFKPQQENVPILQREAQGDSSEVAILKCMEMQIGNVQSYRDKYSKVFEIPFNSVNKYQVSIHQLGAKDGNGFLLAMKGAPEKILEMCSTGFLGNKIINLDSVKKEKIQEDYIELASLGERVLGFCDSRLPLDKYPPGHVFDENTFEIEKIDNIHFVGFIGLIDPPRAAVPDAVLRCKAAGVKVAMITGDHPVTALAIARAVNIISSDSPITNGKIKSIEDVNMDQGSAKRAAVIAGSELELMTPEELQFYISFHEELVFARTSPQMKYEIVKAFQKLGHVVAVTGDGVNDSPALKKADIGIAMGSGTEVSKEVADLILLDDNFSSIVGGIELGRVIFDNLKKLIRFTMADNVAEMYCYWVYIFLKIPLPMGTLGMLLSTLGADVFPAVSLAHESAEGGIMQLKPRDPNRDILLSMPMLSYSYGQVAVIETLAGFLSYFVTFARDGWLPLDLLFCQSRYENDSINDLEDSYGQEWTYESRLAMEKKAQTAFFLAIVITQFSNAICCKTRRVSVFQKGIFSNKLMNVGLILMICVPCIFIYTPGLNTAVSFVPVGYESWLASLPFAIVLFLYDECRRYLLRRTNSRWIVREFTT